MTPPEESDQLPEEGQGGQGGDKDKSGQSDGGSNAGGSDKGDENPSDATGNPGAAG